MNVRRNILAHVGLVGGRQHDVGQRSLERRDVGVGRFDHTGYKIFNVFPNALFASMGAVFVATHFAPLDPASTSLATLVFDFTDTPIADADLPGLIEYCRTFLREDREICEGLHEAIELAPARIGPPVLGKLEERVSWFHDAYRGHLKGVHA